MSTEDFITAGKITAAATAITNPPLGVAAAGFFELISHQLQNRNQQFLEQVHHRLIQLEKTGILELNHLKEHESFLSILLTATQFAERTASKQKRKLLQNVILNGAIYEPEEEKVARITRLIESLDIGHIDILKFLYESTETFTDCSTVSDLYGKFAADCIAYEFDTFAFYLEELKSKRLIRISRKITDEDGLFTDSKLLLSREEEEGRQAILLTKVATELLEYLTAPAAETKAV